MSYDVICLSPSDPVGKVVATYPSKELAEASRQVLNDTSPIALLNFFIVKEHKE